LTLNFDNNSNSLRKLVYKATSLLYEVIYHMKFII